MRSETLHAIVDTSVECLWCLYCMMLFFHGWCLVPAWCFLDATRVLRCQKPNPRRACNWFYWVCCPCWCLLRCWVGECTDIRFILFGIEFIGTSWKRLVGKMVKSETFRKISGKITKIHIKLIKFRKKTEINWKSWERNVRKIGNFSEKIEKNRKKLIKNFDKISIKFR